MTGPDRVREVSLAVGAIDKLIGEHGIEFVRIEQPDLHGIARFKTVPARQLGAAANRGVNFPLAPVTLGLHCEAVTGTGYQEELGYPDALLRPDLETFAWLPWVDATARVLADPHHVDDGRPVLVGSRWVGRELLKQLESLGYRLLSGLEYEFYLLDPESGQAAYPEVRQFGAFHEADGAVVYDIVRQIQALGIDVTTANVEYGAGQVEINFSPAWGQAAADQAYGFKNAVKEIAARHGRRATFMSKPRIDDSGSGCHFNQSLWRDGRNAFVDTDSPDGISAVARHFLAGQLAHAPALTAFLAPTINCYKRFRPHSFAPWQADWGFDNRNVAWRVKSLRDDRTCIENRLGAATANPYLVQAASLAAGLDGIRRKLEPPAPVTARETVQEAALAEAGPWQRLPRRLEDALTALEQDAVLTEALGHGVVQAYLAVKRAEIATARAAIPDFDEPAFAERIDPWERRYYVDLL